MRAASETGCFRGNHGSIRGNTKTFQRLAARGETLDSRTKRDKNATGEGLLPLSPLDRILKSFPVRSESPPRYGPQAKDHRLHRRE